MPRISIIVPVYRVENYLTQCVNSLISQTFHEIEIILVDDGSPDNSPYICDDFGLQDPRIKVIHQDNRGLSGARNAGIAIAKGDYICFVDSDDFVHPQYCEFLLKNITETNADFCACAVKRFTDSETPTLALLGTPASQSLTWSDFLHEQLCGNIEIGVWNRIYKKEIFDKISFKERKLHEDIFFCADLFKVANKCTYIESELYYYRQRNNGIVGQQDLLLRPSPDRIESAQYLLKKAYEHNFEYIDECFKYGINAPWFFVDKIYLKSDFKNNQKFLQRFQSFLRANKSLIKTSPYFSKNVKDRMIIFSLSRFAYTFNVFGRLLFTYILRLMNKDPYKSKHSI